jgi:hypothetical protein
MAISHNPLHRLLRGRVGELVFKQYRWATIITKVPDMNGVKPSAGQKTQRSKLKEAQALASQMMKDPEVKASYQSRCTGKQRPYDLLRAEIMKGIVPLQ